VKVHLRRPWHLDARELTDERAWRQRRRFLKQGIGLLGAGALLGCPPGAFAKNPNKSGPGKDLPLTEDYATLASQPGFPATRNPAFPLDRPLTAAKVAMAHNNFYEFTMEKDRVWKVAEPFQPRPWEIRVTGLVESPLTLQLDDIERLGYEERTYRFRCVEAWAMAVPWTGVPMKKVVELCKPLNSAKYVAFTSFKRPDQARGQRVQKYMPWPYYEGLTMKEAVHPLTLLATGIYGVALPKQHGAPLRLVTPWKYGFKNIKSIVRIHFDKLLPKTFWNDLQPREYSFQGNVNPKVNHPRWSQAREKMIGTGEVRPTAWLNGYASLLGDLYKRQPFVPGWDESSSPF
jgi:sulfoxide reductase catalytic subunit YedY